MSSFLFGATLAAGSLVVLVLLASSAVVIDIAKLHQYGADELLSANDLLQQSWSNLHVLHFRPKRQNSHFQCQDCERKRKNCEKGPKGTAGTNGKPGAAGEPGADGDIGAPGISLIYTSGKNYSGCFRCPEGPAGDPGAPGKPGRRGPLGEAGTNGENPVVLGPDGLAGDKGAMGERGPPGGYGAPGKIGAKADGPSIPGPRGAPGNRGPPGPPGIPAGVNLIGGRGPRGPRGHQGRQGEQGRRGPRGPPGRFQCPCRKQTTPATTQAVYVTPPRPYKVPGYVKIGYMSMSRRIA